MKYIYILKNYQRLIQFQALQTLVRKAMKTLGTNSSYLGITPNQSWSLHQRILKILLASPISPPWLKKNASSSCPQQA